MLHITFTDGSEPYCFRGTDAEIRRELRRWSRHFRLFGEFKSRLGIVFVNASVK